jgi:hypothetical protein
MRQVLALLCAGIVALAAAGAAFSAGPVREPIVFEPFTFAAGEVCPFAVTIDAVVNKEILKDFGDHLIITGRLVAQVTNDETEQSVVLNVSGPAKVIFTEDAATQYGRGLGLNFFFPGDLGPGSEGALLWTRGPMIQRFSEEGLEIVRMAPVVRDVCAMLAA